MEPNLCLNFSVLPSQAASEPAGSASPPPRTSASVPFLWEEAPGKPSRQWCSTTTCEEITSKSLGLPPRLLAAEVKITKMPSPTTVLYGPNVGRSLSFRSPGWDGHRGIVNAHFGSSRWGSFRKIKAFSGGTFDISSAVDESGHDVVSCDDHNDDDVKKIAKVVRRRGSFLSLSHRSTSSTPSSHNLLASIYESFRQVVPWKRKQEKQRKMAS